MEFPRVAWAPALRIDVRAITAEICVAWKIWYNTLRNTMHPFVLILLSRQLWNEGKYDSVADVPESWVWLRVDFQSGSRVLKKVFWTLSYLYLWHTMWFHSEFGDFQNMSVQQLCKGGFRPQKSSKKAQKTDHSVAIYSNFWIGMVYFGYHLVKAHVQTVQNMYGKEG